MPDMSMTSEQRRKVASIVDSPGPGYMGGVNAVYAAVKRKRIAVTRHQVDVFLQNRFAHQIYRPTPRAPHGSQAHMEVFNQYEWAVDTAYVNDDFSLRRGVKCVHTCWNANVHRQC